MFIPAALLACAGSFAAGVASDSRGPAVVDRLNSWAAEHAVLSRVKVAATESAGLGLVCTEDVEAGESVLVWPRSFSLGMENLFGSSGPATVDAFAPRLSSRERLRSMLLLRARAADPETGAVRNPDAYPVDDEEQVVALAAWLVLDEARPDSPLRPWLDALPADDGAFPLAWDTDALGGDGAMPASFAALLHDHRDNARAAHKRLKRMMASMTDGDVRGAFRSYRRFRRAYSLVASRSWSLGGRRYLVPVADFVNHRDGSGEGGAGAPFTGWDPRRPGDASAGAGTRIASDDGANFIWLAPHSCRAGEPLEDRYSHASAALFLLYFGFVPAQAPHDCAEARLPDALAAFARDAAAAAPGGAAAAGRGGPPQRTNSQRSELLRRLATPRVDSLCLPRRRGPGVEVPVPVQHVADVYYNVDEHAASRHLDDMAEDLAGWTRAVWRAPDALQRRRRAGLAFVGRAARDALAALPDPAPGAAGSPLAELLERERAILRAWAFDVDGAAAGEGRMLGDGKDEL